MTSREYMLDTDVASYAIRGDNPVLQKHFRFTPAARIVLSVVTSAELLYGIKRYPLTHPRREEVLSFLDNARILPWDRAAAEAYADIRNSLTKSGALIGELDMMIAAHALSTGRTLVSNNARHYERIAPPLQLENWAEA